MGGLLRGRTWGGGISDLVGVEWSGYEGRSRILQLKPVGAPGAPYLPIVV
jgi:hypothetical protein